MIRRSNDMNDMKRHATERRRRTGPARANRPRRARADDTEPTLADEALRASEERYRNLFENANNVVFTTDLQMRFTSLNLAGEAITGYTRAEALRLTLADVVATEYMEQIHERLRDQLAGNLT